MLYSLNPPCSVPLKVILSKFKMITKNNESMRKYEKILDFTATKFLCLSDINNNEDISTCSRYLQQKPHLVFVLTQSLSHRHHIGKLFENISKNPYSLYRVYVTVIGGNKKY